MRLIHHWANRLTYTPLPAACGKRFTPAFFDAEAAVCLLSTFRTSLVHLTITFLFHSRFFRRKWRNQLDYQPHTVRTFDRRAYRNETATPRLGSADSPTSVFGEMDHGAYWGATVTRIFHTSTAIEITKTIITKTHTEMMEKRIKFKSSFIWSPPLSALPPKS